MNRNFLTDAELAAMDLPLAMRAAACFSGLTDREIISRMGWEPRNGYRLLAPNDDYWPSVPSLPRLCRVLGNDVLPRWLAIKSRVDMALPCRELTPEALLASWAICSAARVRWPGADSAAWRTASSPWMRCAPCAGVWKICCVRAWARWACWCNAREADMPAGYDVYECGAGVLSFR